MLAFALGQAAQVDDVAFAGRAGHRRAFHADALAQAGGGRVDDGRAVAGCAEHADAHFLARHGPAHITDDAKQDLGHFGGAPGIGSRARLRPRRARRQRSAGEQRGQQHDSEQDGRRGVLPVARREGHGVGVFMQVGWLFK
ncbi:hypothetical protein D3C81_1461910 [compost metagenome]